MSLEKGEIKPWKILNFWLKLKSNASISCLILDCCKSSFQFVAVCNCTAID